MKILDTLKLIWEVVIATIIYVDFAEPIYYRLKAEYERSLYVWVKRGFLRYDKVKVVS